MAEKTVVIPRAIRVEAKKNGPLDWASATAAIPPGRLT